MQEMTSIVVKRKPLSIGGYLKGKGKKEGHLASRKSVQTPPKGTGPAPELFCKGKERRHPQTQGGEGGSWRDFPEAQKEKGELPWQGLNMRKKGNNSAKGKRSNRQLTPRKVIACKRKEKAFPLAARSELICRAPKVRGQAQLGKRTETERKGTFSFWGAIKRKD